MRNQSDISFWCGVLSRDWILVNVLAVYLRVTLYLFVALIYFSHHISLSYGDATSS